MRKSGAVAKMPEMLSLTDYLRDADATLIFTGAGVSTDSGLPDYRGPSGLWRQRRPLRLQEFLESDAARVEYWEAKLASAESFREARPNAIHRAIRRLEDAGKLLMVVTQNVDGLHSAAGTTPEHLIELHGTQSRVECLGCGKRSDPESHYEHFRSTRTPPRCNACGGWLKVATISFGQKLKPAELQRAYHAAATCDLVIAMGSTLSVHPAATIPLSAAGRGIPYIVINHGFTDHDEEPALTLKLEGDIASHFVPAVNEATGTA